MAFFKNLKDLDRKFSWSFLGFVLAALFGLLTIYDRFLADKHPRLFFDVLASTAVLDIKEDVPKLDIQFNGINIRENDLSLHIITLKIVNDSSKDILTSHYDPDDPLGLVVSTGEIIRTELIEGSNSYLARNVEWLPLSKTQVLFDEFIIEAQQFFIVKLLILHPSKEIPTVTPVGHIAGTPEVAVRDLFENLGKESFLSRTFDGTLIVQFTRLLSYFVLAILIILSIVIPIVLFSDMLSKRRRKRLVKEFRSATSVNLNENDELIFTSFIKEQVDVLFGMRKFAENRDLLDQAFDSYKRLLEEDGRPRRQATPVHRAYFGLDDETIHYLIPQLIKGSFVQVEDGKPSVDEHLAETLEHFFRFLSNKGETLSEIRLAEEHGIVSRPGSMPVFETPNAEQGGGGQAATRAESK